MTKHPNKKKTPQITKTALMAIESHQVATVINMTCQEKNEESKNC